MKTEISNLEIIKAAKEFSEDKNEITIENIGAYLGFKAGAKYVLKRLQTKNSNMFSAQQMEQAWKDGCECGETRSGFFDIEDYTKN